jgi:mono/diheme cytochrome c family protein
MLRPYSIAGCCLILLSLAGALAIASKHFIASADDKATHTAMPEDAASMTTDWDRRWWIDKSARLLRGGKGIGPDDDMASLMRMSDEEITRRFMADRGFGDTVLDFNLFFLGFKSDSLKSGRVYDRAVFGFPNAIASAQAAMHGGDYLKLLDFIGPFYMAPLRSEPLDDKPAKEDAGLSLPQFRTKVVVELEAAFSELTETVRRQSDPKAACSRVQAFAGRSQQLTDRVHRAFDDSEIFVITRGRMLTAPMEAVTTLVGASCTDAKRGPDTGRELADALENIWLSIEKGFDELGRFEPALYQPKAVDEFRTFDLEKFPAPTKWIAFGFEQGLALGNSSTNHNRKRAAYVLKRFFCDDLVPIGAEEPQEHTDGAHGSETSCFACHHKLDPMAGFFRNYGAYFFDYSNSPFIIFDDLASTDREEYLDNWRLKGDPQREWNVGFIRSPRWEQHNVYGQSMQDLSRIARRAPEVTRCLMRRMVEYFVAEDQAIDAGYLDDLSNRFTADARENSSNAMKNAIARIVQSAAFHQRDADPTRCYDLAGADRSVKGPPCRVASLLTKNCAQCHGNGIDYEGGLDLSSWIDVEIAPGIRRGAFPHMTAEGVQVAPKDTLARIAERLASNDPKRRMPFQRVMQGQERQELFMWVQDELTRLGPEARK